MSFSFNRTNLRGGSAQTSPSGTPVCGRRGRQLPIVPPKGAPDRSMFVSFLSGERAAPSRPVALVLGLKELSVDFKLLFIQSFNL